ncbi:hypothetical protein BIV57_07705, partial [Mangrovactinospora gilvigrisea]
MKRALVLGLAALLVLPLIVLLPMLLAGGDAASATCAGGASVDSAAVAEAVQQILDKGAGAKTPKVEGLSDPGGQIPNAKIVVATGIAMNVPARGQVIALATALQESGLRNLSYGDRDSLGLFQQRPSQGWGSAAQITDPVHASTAFYTHLLHLSGWQQMTVDQAAQHVQQSATPGAYAHWEPLATALQTALATHLNGTTTPTPTPGTAEPVTDVSCTSTNAAAPPPGTVPAGYRIPAGAPAAVRAALQAAMARLGTPYQWGGTCTAPKSGDPMKRCDCSSLVQQSYAAAGIGLPRTTYAQVHAGRPAPQDALEAGDLLFTEGSAAAPNHVGIYLGSGYLIEAPHTGAVVRIVPLS